MHVGDEFPDQTDSLPGIQRDFLTGLPDIVEMYMDSGRVKIPKFFLQGQGAPVQIPEVGKAVIGLISAGTDDGTTDMADASKLQIRLRLLGRRSEFFRIKAEKFVRREIGVCVKVDNFVSCAGFLIA